jgi:hypothetical protein
MKSLLLFAAGILLIAACDPKTGSLRSDVSPETLEQNFVNPPASAKPHTWWHWMNGNITKEGITADLEAMAEAGIGGAQIFNAAEGIPRGPVQFNSPEWIDMVKHAALEAKRLGLELCLHNCAGWSSSGGPWNTPEHSMKIVVTSETQIKGPVQVTAAPPQPKTNLDFYRDIAVLAFRTPVVDAEKTTIPGLNAKIFLDRNWQLVRNDNFTFDSNDNAEKYVTLPEEMLVKQDAVVDLTEKLIPSNGKVTAWDAPNGEWTVLRIGYTSNGRKNHPAPTEGTGLECDKLSKEAIKAHWDGHIALILDAIGKMDGPDKPGLNNVLIDSYEVGTQNWTQGFENEFLKRTGYSIIKFLPVLSGRIVDSREITERFLWDFRRVIADLFAESYSEYFGELAHNAGLLYSSEPYGNCPSDDIQYGSYCDIPMGEFWQNSGHSVDIGNSKLPSSIAHVYGKRVVGAEAFTAAPDGGKWTKDAYAIKAQGDAAYCGGINRMIYHRYAHQPWTNPTRYPGMTMGQWGTHFERTLTWWKQAKDWLRYQARCQYLLQEGLFVADVLFYCGEGAPNELPKITLPKGYDYDGCDTRALKMLKVKDGRLVLPSGMNYRLLVLPDDSEVSPEILKTIDRLASEGATIVGKKQPDRAPGLRNYPGCDDEVKKLAGKVWSKIISDKSPSEVLNSLAIKPDFTADENANLKYIHRNINGVEVYFVASPSRSGDELDCTFRISGKTPEFWHPESGITETVPVYREEDGLTTIPMRFDPSGSVFVVFRDPATADHAVDVKFAAASEKPKVVNDLKIIKAEYGYFADGGIEKCTNVTSFVRSELAEGNLTIHASNDRFGGDPAIGVIKQLRIDYKKGGVKKRVETNEGQSIALPEGAEIMDAYYGVVSNVPEKEPERKTVDVTDKMKQLVKDGILETTVNNQLNDGKDPASMFSKEVRVEYAVNGTRGWIKAVENRILLLPPKPNSEIPLPAYTLEVTDGGKLLLQAWKPGTFEVALASGKTNRTEIANVPEPAEIDGAWQLSFPPDMGAPEKVVLDKLVSWTEHSDAGVKYFSGTATYDKQFTWSGKTGEDVRIILDFGTLKNFAEVELNGKALPLLWKPPYRLDVTDAIKTGENTLQVKITNLWPNRLIGDELLPDDREWNGIRLKEWPEWLLEGKPSPTGRFTFTTWHHWKKEDKPLPSGLLGPVCLRTVKSIALPNTVSN